MWPFVELLRKLQQEQRPHSWVERACAFAAEIHLIRHRRSGASRIGASWSLGGEVLTPSEPSSSSSTLGTASRMPAVQPGFGSCTRATGPRYCCASLVSFPCSKRSLCGLCFVLNIFDGGVNQLV